MLYLTADYADLRRLKMGGVCHGHQNYITRFMAIQFTRCDISKLDLIINLRKSAVKTF